MAATNGPQPQAVMPQIGVLAQYVKDLSFENPNAPRSLTPTGQQPTLNVQVHVDAKPASETDVEVVAAARRQGGVAGNAAVQLRAHFWRHLSRPERAGGQHAGGRADRVPASSLSICARDHRDGGAQRRLPAAPARSDRFRRSLPPADRAERSLSPPSQPLNPPSLT